MKDASTSGHPIQVREEAPSDHAEVERIVRSAFAGTTFGHQGEADLVAALRASPGALSLVAVEGEGVVGHLLFTRVRLEGDAGGAHEGWGLAPMAVRPDRQGAGVGTALVEHGMKCAEARGEAFVVVFGHAEYYPRFGFAPAAESGVRHAFEGLPPEPFFLRVFDEALRQSGTAGIARYRSEFGPQA